MKLVRPHAWAPALFLALSIGFFLPTIVLRSVPLPLENVYYPGGDRYWRASRPAAVSSPPNFMLSDVVNQNYPWMFTTVQRLQHFQIPLWNPYIYGGMPLLGAQQAAVLYPLTLLGMTLGPNWIWVATGIVRLFLMGWGLYLLMRHFGLGALGALWSGVTYQFAGANIVWLHYPVHNVLAWLPLALYATLRLLEEPRGRWFLLLTACLAFQFLGGHPETSVLFALVWGSFTLASIDWRDRPVRRLALAAASAIAALGLTLPQLLPALELIPQSVTYHQRAGHEVVATLSNALKGWSNLRRWLLLVNPYVYGTPLGDRYLDPLHNFNYNDLAGYMGLFTIPWMIAGIVGGRPRRRVAYWSALAILSLGLMYPLPGFDLVLRIPALRFGQGIRYQLTWSLAAAVLAGFGVECILRGSVRGRRLVGVVATICVLALLWSVYDLSTARHGSWILNKTPGPNTLAQVAAVYNRQNVQLVVLITAASLSWLVLMIMFVARQSRRGAVVLLVVTYVELLIHGVPYYGFAPPAAIFPPTRITRTLRAPLGQFRVATLDGLMAGNTAMTQGLENLTGLDDLVAVRYQQFVDRARKIGHERDTYLVKSEARRLFDLANVRYLISSQKVKNEEGGRQWKLVMDDHTIRVYENPTVLPRAYLVPAVRRAAPDQELGAVADPAFDPRRQAIVEEPVAGLETTPATPSSGRALITSYQPERVAVDTRLGRTGFLVLSDTYYPGWQAAVDGRAVHLYRADAVFRGVVVPPGTHRVVFSYRPASWAIGRAVALCTLLASLAACRWARWRRLRRECAAPG